MKQELVKTMKAEFYWNDLPFGKEIARLTKERDKYEKRAMEAEVITEDGRTIRCDLEGDLVVSTGIGYIPHWATCPASKQFKKQGRDDT